MDEADVAYCLLEDAALWFQGVDIPVSSVVLSVQWDNFKETWSLFTWYTPTEINSHPEYDDYTFQLDGMQVEVRCYYNTVVATDPHRMEIAREGQAFWVKSIDYYLHAVNEGHPYFQAIKRYLHDLQVTNNEVAKLAWTKGTYDAWLQRFGEPEEVAKSIKKDPLAKITSISKWTGELEGQRVINLLGSHGTKAIAMAKLGASATVVDISEENARYAQEVAEAAGVELRYIVSDVLSLNDEELVGSYDLVFMELGILHYFVDLTPLFEIVSKLLKPGGRMILQDFHPISTKLITSKGKKHKVAGNYFSKNLIPTQVAFTKYLTEEKEISYVYERKWTLGEIITAVAQVGLFIKELDEQPNIKLSDRGIPKLFTIVAEKKE